MLRHFSSDHYTALANDYDSIYTTFRMGQLPVIQQMLDLQPDDVLVDIGGGTGWMSNTLWKSASLKNPVLCVDPSSQMLEKAKDLEGVTPVNASAAEFFGSATKGHFNKVFMAGCIHHFGDLDQVLRSMAELMSPGDACLILVDTKFGCPPFPEFIAPHQGDSLLLALRGTGFSAHTDAKSFNYKVPKARHYLSLRKRFLSHLEQFSDDEIEQQIQNLDRSLGVDETVSLDICCEFTLAVKKWATDFLSNHLRSPGVWESSAN